MPSKASPSNCFVAYLPDAAILAAAVEAAVDHFVTLDRENYLYNLLISEAQVRICPPGDFISWFRSTLELPATGT